MGTAEGIALSVEFGIDHANFVESVLYKSVLCGIGST